MLRVLRFAPDDRGENQNSPLALLHEASQLVPRVEARDVRRRKPAARFSGAPVRGAMPPMPNKRFDPEQAVTLPRQIKLKIMNGEMNRIGKDAQLLRNSAF